MINKLLENEFDIILIQKGDSIRCYSYIENNGSCENLNIEKLSSREKEILELITIGLSNKEISEKLEISLHTVKNHLYSIFKKLSVSDRTQAAVVAMKNYNHKNVSRETL